MSVTPTKPAEQPAAARLPATAQVDLRGPVMFVVLLLLGLAAAEGLARYVAFPSFIRISDNPELGFEPNDPSIIARFDNYGTIPRERVPGKLRIAVLGDSVVEGGGLPAFFSIPALVARTLDERFADVGARFEVINAAVGGYDIRQTRVRFETQVAPYKPDLVVYVWFSNDFNFTDAILGYAGRPLLLLPSYTRRKHWFEDPAIAISQHSMLFGFLYARAVCFFRCGGPSWSFQDDHQLGGIEFDKLADATARVGAQFVVATYVPFRGPLPDPNSCAPDPMQKECYASVSLDIVRGFARRRHVPEIDLTTTLLRTPGEYRNHPNSDDFTHPNGKGNRLLATDLAEQLVVHVAPRLATLGIDVSATRAAQSEPVRSPTSPRPSHASAPR